MDGLQQTHRLKEHLACANEAETFSPARESNAASPVSNDELSDWISRAESLIESWQTDPPPPGHRYVLATSLATEKASRQLEGDPMGSLTQLWKSVCLGREDEVSQKLNAIAARKNERGDATEEAGLASQLLMQFEKSAAENPFIAKYKMLREKLRQIASDDNEFCRQESKGGPQGGSTFQLRVFSCDRTYPRSC